MTPGLDFEAKYGLNKSRFWVRPGLTLRMLAFNSSRPLFRNNPRLRRAVNFALDRRALVAASYGPVASTATDQHIPPACPGFATRTSTHCGANLARAGELARGQLRNGKAVLHVETTRVGDRDRPAREEAAREDRARDRDQDHPGATWAAAPRGADQSRGAETGTSRSSSGPRTSLTRTQYLSLLLETQLQGGETLTRVRSKRASAALARAARLPQGRARNLAYAEVDEMIARDIAPVAVLSVFNEATLVSERVGCMVLRPALDLAVACLRE